MTPDDQVNDPRDTSAAPRTPDSPASCSSLDEDPFSIQPQHLPGHLDLLPVSLDEYLDLPDKAENRYEYVDGLLRFRPRMADKQHGQIIEYLQARLAVAVEPSNMRVTGEVKVQTRPSRQVRIPDVTVGAYEPTARGSAQSPNSRIAFPRSRAPPTMVVEVTSPSNRMNDLCIKSKEYYATGIEVYIIVDRERTTTHPQGCVRVRTGTLSTRRRDDYSHEKIYAGTDRVKCCFLDHDPPFTKDILQPPTSGAQFHHAVVLRERLAKDRAIAKERREKDEAIEKERREKDKAIAKKDEAIAKERREKDEAIAKKDEAIARARRKKDEAKKKAKKRKNENEQLTAWMKGKRIEVPAELQHGSDDSSGSSRSSPASPERQRRKI